MLILTDAKVPHQLIIEIPLLLLNFREAVCMMLMAMIQLYFCSFNAGVIYDFRFKLSVNCQVSLTPQFQPVASPTD
jgi:hypothetical protein